MRSINQKKAILSVFLLALLIISTFTVSAYAATSGSGATTSTITVVTKANWSKPGQESITLSQTAGKMWSNPKHTSTFSQYGRYNIIATPTSGASTTVVKNALSGGRMTLKLAADTTYKITVSWDNVCPQNMVGTSWTNTGLGWATYPSWRVSGSCKSTYK